jgi:hypothetical protein
VLLYGTPGVSVGYSEALLVHDPVTHGHRDPHPWRQVRLDHPIREGGYIVAPFTSQNRLPSDTQRKKERGSQT